MWNLHQEQAAGQRKVEELKTALHQVQLWSKVLEEKKEAWARKNTSLETKLQLMAQIITKSQDALTKETKTREKLEEMLREVERDRADENQAYIEDRAKWRAETTSLRHAEEALKKKVQAEQQKTMQLKEEMQGLQRKMQREKQDKERRTPEGGTNKEIMKTEAASPQTPLQSAASVAG